MIEMERARIELILSYPFYATLAMHLDVVETDRMPTLATDGTHLFYNPEFIKRLTREQAAAVVAHEVLHCALAHLDRRGSREKMRFNIAADFAVNDLLDQDGFELPPGCLLDDAFRDMAAEDIYEKIKVVTVKDPFGTGGTLDSHEEWGKGGGDQDSDGEGGDDKDSGKDGADKSGADDKQDSVGGNDQKPLYNPVVWRDRVAKAANIARMQGKLPAHIEQMVGELLHPQLDWRIILRDFIQASIRNNYRLSPPNKRYLHIPIYLPSTYGEKVEVAVAIDTSGSISDDEVQEFLSEIQGIMDQFEDYTVHVMQCDAEVHDYTVVSPFDGELPMKVMGRGGTDFRPPFKELEKRNIQPPCLVYMTDGYGTFPEDEPSYPVFWLMTTDVKPPFGEAIPLRKETQ